jgi:hypothetical protein
MVNVGLFVKTRSKARQRKGRGQFSGNRSQAGQREPTTTVWFALKLGPSTFGVFDAFPNEEGRQNHLTGKIATALMANAGELFSTPPVIERLDVLGAKLAA